MKCSVLGSGLCLKDPVLSQAAYVRMSLCPSHIDARMFFLSLCFERENIHKL